MSRHRRPSYPLVTRIAATTLVAVLSRVTGAQSTISERSVGGRFGLAADEIVRVDRGEIVAHRLTDVNGDEIAFVAAVRVGTSATRAANRMFEGDLPGRGASVSWRTDVSRPPRPADFQTYQLPKEDVDALRDCLVGNCVLKLPAAAIAGLRRLDWRSDGIGAQASDVLRAWLFEYARNYETIGNDALVVYDDGKAPLPLHEGFHQLLAAAPFWKDDAPEFHHYLDAFPRQRLGSVRDTLTCYLEDFGLRPLTTMVHSSLYVLPERPGRDVRGLLARKQVFASHYFRARLSLLATVDAMPGDAYVIWLDRSLFDSKLNRFVRGRVEGKLEEDLRSRLQQIQRALSPARR